MRGKPSGPSHKPGNHTAIRELDDTTTKASTDWPVTSGAHRPLLLILYREESSQLLHLGDGEGLTVGRASNAQVIVDDGRTSRQHARLWREGDRVFVEDLGSTNGTRVNGVPVTHAQRVGPGDEIGVGTATIAVSTLSLTVGNHRVLSDGELDDRLESEVDRARRYCRPLSLLMIRFSGAAAAVRQQLCSLSSVLRRMDVLANYGPREYAVVLPEADGAAARAVAQRLLLALAPSTRGTISMGVGTFPGDSHSSGSLLDITRQRLRNNRAGRLPQAQQRPTDAAVPRPPHLVAQSRVMMQTLDMARKVGATDTTVLLIGETGCGKQVVAEEIHRSSQRHKGPLVHLNCAALPPGLMESELFGHERGAFTGADRRHVGHVESAAGGTLFLDEIGELPAQAQPKLLQFLENQTFTRVGGTRAIRGNVRIIAATNRDLEQDTQTGRFRQDLFFRLSSFLLHIPPLRERPEDIVPLAQLFCAEFSAALNHPPAELRPEVLEILNQHDWPGNVRQLRNTIERAVVLAEGNPIGPEHLTQRVATRRPTPSTAQPGNLEQQMVQLEKQVIQLTLHECKGNQTEAARRLGITRRALIYRLDKYGLSSGK